MLQAFSVVFQKAIERAEGADNVDSRVLNLIDCISYFVFLYTTRGLFECDKLIFTSQMAFQVWKYSIYVSFEISILFYIVNFYNRTRICIEEK